MNLFRPSGGLIYHWRALRNQRHWYEFRKDVEEWLHDWPQFANELILIGPSAGYTLTTAWLKKFTRISAYDVDPLAGMLFRLKHPGLNIRFHNEDLFWTDDEGYTTNTLREILKQNPSAAVLMSNVVGQLLLEHPVKDREWSRFLHGLRMALNGREWASYHDLFTHENGEVIDHLTGGDWKADLKTIQFRWPLTATSLHIVEGVRT